MNEEENLGGAVDAPENTNLGESNDAPTETPVEETPVEAPVTEATIEEASTETPVETPIDTPVASPITAAPESKKGGMGWKIATFAFLATTILCCSALAFLVFSDGKTSIFNRTISSMSSDKAKQQNVSNNVEEPADTPDEQKKEDTDTKTDTDTDTKKDTSTDCPSTDSGKTNNNTATQCQKYANIDYKSFAALFKKDETPIPRKIEYTNDGKYIFIILENVDDGASGWYGVWYRENKDGSKWTELWSGQQLGSCSKYTEAQRKLMKDYKYLDDTQGTYMLGCIE
jgi:hypothetical protein